ncbi:MAG: bifunctional folylpolyglutamate synthase/dihydrofolate synthase [Rhodobacteraceae bacterium]|nr:bifunctional folylpolyglutamate synthase/dihydrofolate synthase [Paracoccaceae bacterium]
MTLAGSDVILERLTHLHPKVIDLSLARIERLCAALGHPERALPAVIHVAGTNGKGSTQAMIRAGLEARGGRVHAYISPHLVRFHERIRLAGTLIAEEALARLLDECERANEGREITFFEITTAAAFLAFARTPAEWTLLEVGLGGRLDATNVVPAPRLTVITPVSIDHEAYLGSTLALIAGEKAGILKPGVPCVTGPQPPAAMAVIEARAALLGAPLIAHGRDWLAWEERGRLVFQDGRGLLDLPRPNLPGPHQIDNAGAAVAALRALGADEGAVAAGVSGAEWPARMQRLGRGPLAAAAPLAELWLDGGHNPAAGEALAATLKAMPARPTHLVCGMLATKDVGGFLRPLAPHVARLHAVAIPDAPATLAAAATAAAAAAAGIAAEAAADVPAAVAAIAAAEPRARIVICGSLYLAGTVLRDNG